MTGILCLSGRYYLKQKCDCSFLVLILPIRSASLVEQVYLQSIRFERYFLEHTQHINGIRWASSSDVQQRQSQPTNLLYDVNSEFVHYLYMIFTVDLF
jgi:hypothetical protein